MRVQPKEVAVIESMVDQIETLCRDIRSELARTKAAHEVTRNELIWERGWDLLRKAPISDAWRVLSDISRAMLKEDHPVLFDALSALDRTEGERAATPPESPVPAEAPREIRVGSQLSDPPPSERR